MAALRSDTPHKCNRVLTSIVLRNNNITHAGGRAVAHALTYNANLDVHSRLEMLDLWGNSLQAAGAKNVGQMLEKNSTLTILDLSNNAIGTEGMSYIAEARLPC